MTIQKENQKVAVLVTSLGSIPSLVETLALMLRNASIRI